MTDQEKNYLKDIKHFVDQGLSMAESFLKVFEHYEIHPHESLMEAILKRYSIADLQIGNDYFFADGSRLNIDSYYDCMIATKSPNSNPNTGMDL
ncbi:MAG: hypothetical protein PUP46_00225 [Endozoicomonas sp. (ex Botrylloides leachii)]|nr:hypothetical protein [Endozoicomonas sp. (ex Botrylloides leachii)]